MKSACYIFPVSHHYRKPFHEKLRKILADHDVDYRVYYCEPGEENLRKKDTVDIEWGRKVGLTGRFGSLCFQHALHKAWQHDLLIIQQENKLLLNYILSLASVLRLKRVAYFGHGRNFQSRNPNGLGERWKRFWATKANWWFGYTDETRRHVESIGFPPEQITVFNNSVDTSAMREQVAAITPERLEQVRTELGLVGKHVGVFVGGIYPDKRLPFLVEAGELIRQRIPEFEMIVVGGGSNLPVLEELAKSREWIHVTGPRFGEAKVALMLLGHVFLMPGLMGLAILDAGVAGLPIATTAYPWHSPEIAYLSPGENGVMVEDWQSAAAYAEAVVGILADPDRQQSMSDAARAMADRYSIEAMAENFAAGVLKALGRTPRVL